MKRITLTVFLFCAIAMASAQTNVTANVQKLSGKPVFVYSEPAKDYEVVFKREIKLVMSSSQINSIGEIVEKLGKMCEKYAEKEKLEYDALIMRDLTAEAIKFK